MTIEFKSWTKNTIVEDEECCVSIDVTLKYSWTNVHQTRTSSHPSWNLKRNLGSSTRDLQWNDSLLGKIYLRYTSESSNVLCMFRCRQLVERRHRNETQFSDPMKMQRGSRLLGVESLGWCKLMTEQKHTPHTILGNPATKEVVLSNETRSTTTFWNSHLLQRCVLYGTGRCDGSLRSVPLLLNSRC